MGFELKVDEPVEDGIKRIAKAQTEKIFADLSDEALSHHDKVHQVRKRCKKIRGLVRLVRPQFEQYQQANQAFRDAPRLLSPLRDAQSVIDTFDKLMEAFDNQLKGPAFASVKQVLLNRRERLSKDKRGIQSKLAKFKKRIERAAKEIGDWQLKQAGSKALSGGLAKTYQRGLKAMAKAHASPSTENFHQWRKRCKYHWYHLRLLTPCWAPVLAPLAEQVHQLSDSLGEEHDLAVLRGTILASPHEFGQFADLQLLFGMIDRRRAALRSRAFNLGRKVFVLNARQTAKCYSAYWQAWQEEDAELHQPSPFDAQA
ncbi:CHAD domain-containing protein [Bowmanella dokdonensis]|uniref:CHAD domain-containing protein n=1 Tax=Bowmanella dokdonensis TaxID=751969 RepID=A0A939DQA1_9ALTE|nr:CHAD domain-containing protein [Bowmanella dokdonensis]MBN7826240.1 CHAD domain-containing protein [Bowmanella dokdonensis]